MARDPVTVKNPGCLVLLGWLQALEKHRAISSEGNFHETALWGHPALAPPHFFPRKAASSPNRTPENVDLRNVNKNKQEKEAFGNLGKAGKGAAQWKAPQDLKKSSLLFVHCTGVNAMKLSLGARYLAGTMFLLAKIGGFMWTSSPDRRNFPFKSKLGDWPWWWKYFLKKQGIVHPQFLGWWMQGRGIECRFPDTTKRHSKLRDFSMSHTWQWTHNWTCSWHQNRAASKKSSTGSSTVPLNNNFFSTRWF